MKRVLKSLAVVPLVVVLLAVNVHAQSAKDAYMALRKFDAKADAGLSKSKLLELWGDTKAEVEMYLESKAAKKNPQFASELAEVLKEFQKAADLFSKGNDYMGCTQLEGVAHKKFQNMRKP